jgi:hypothetical protein
MEYPTIRAKQKSRQVIDTFLGYNHNLRIGENEFYDMRNMTSDNYPVLSTRGGRVAHGMAGTYANRIISKDELCMVIGNNFFIGTASVDMELNSKPKQLVSMGAYVIILPDKKWINTICDENGEYKWGNIEHTNAVNTNIDTESNASIVYLRLCDEDGVEYTQESIRPGVKPVEEDGNMWLDTDYNPPILKRYSETNEQWIVVQKTYLRISAKDSNIGEGFVPGDSIELSGIVHDAWSNLNGNHAIVTCGSNYIVIEGMPNNVDDEVESIVNGGIITISRKMPDMDFIIESNNRLWGCHYGLNSNGEFVNEIYASKLGDFKNWNDFRGISTDSYAASCGTDGPFTGAINHMGYPLFFKENCIHKVYGDYPANFRIQSTECRGVELGSNKSLAIVGDTLFYKSRDAVCAYDGGLPVEVSTALGNVHYYDAVAGAIGNKYYIGMTSGEDGIQHLFVFDTQKGLWHKENAIEILQMCAHGGKLYCITGNTLFAEALAPINPETNVVILDANGSFEEFAWMVQSGLIGMAQPDMKYLTKLLIRMSLDVGAEMKIRIRYDSVGDWEQVYALVGTSLRSFVIPVKPRRCDHFEMRIEGSGQCKIYSIAKTTEQGSDFS